MLSANSQPLEIKINVTPEMPEFRQKDNPTLKKIVEIYNSDVIKKYIEDHYKGALIPAF